MQLNSTYKTHFCFSIVTIITRTCPQCYFYVYYVHCFYHAVSGNYALKVIQGIRYHMMFKHKKSAT